MFILYLAQLAFDPSSLCRTNHYDVSKQTTKEIERKRKLSNQYRRKARD
jgi:hypothetical protein